MLPRASGDQEEPGQQGPGFGGTESFRMTKNRGGKIDHAVVSLHTYPRADELGFSCIPVWEQGVNDS